MKSPYSLILAASTTCNVCGQVVWLLCADVPGLQPPSFYLCRCGQVGHIGVGHIGTIAESDNEEPAGPGLEVEEDQAP